MTTRTELLEMIANGENSGVGFKRDVLRSHELARELVAFLNLEGGMVLLGVDDDGTVTGLTRDRLEEWVMTACRDKIRPGIVPFFETVRDVRPGSDVAVVRVPQGIGVHSRRHNSGNARYIRVGSRSREPTPRELGWLFRQRGAFPADRRPVSGSGIDDLDRRRLKDYFERVRQQDVPADDDRAGWRTLLVNTGVVVEEGVSLAGMLLFGSVPNRFLPRAGIDAAAFPGTGKDCAARERRALRGPMTPLMNRDGAALETGLVDQALEFVRRNTAVTAVLDSGASRAARPAYPVEAVREAVVNALIHRDHLLADTDVELAMYRDRLEIVSPGSLPDGMTPQRMRAGTRAARNEFLKDVMRDYGYLEHMGLGVPRKIVRGMREHNGTDPDLVEADERFIVRLFAEPQPEDPQAPRRVRAQPASRAVSRRKMPDPPSTVRPGRSGIAPERIRRDRGAVSGECGFPRRPTVSGAVAEARLAASRRRPTVFSIKCQAPPVPPCALASAPAPDSARKIPRPFRLTPPVGGPNGLPETWRRGRPERMPESEDPGSAAGARVRWPEGRGRMRGFRLPGRRRGPAPGHPDAAGGRRVQSRTGPCYAPAESGSARAHRPGSTDIRPLESPGRPLGRRKPGRPLRWPARRRRDRDNVPWRKTWPDISFPRLSPPRWRFRQAPPRTRRKSGSARPRPRRDRWPAAPR